MSTSTARIATTALALAVVGALATGCNAVLGLGDFSDQGAGGAGATTGGQGGATTGTGGAHQGGAHQGGGGGALACAPGTADCDGDGASCEATLAHDPKNCGACGVACSGEGTLGPKCKGGKCFLECDSNHADCDGSVEDGCEVDISSDVANCGSCGRTCKSDHGKAACLAGSCELACDPGFGDCDGDGSNGCEQGLTTGASNCGACGKVCGKDHTDSSMCDGGTCVLACHVGFADCDGDPSNGCEQDVYTSMTNCGGCGKACSNANADSASCNMGTCNLTCKYAHEDCDKDGANGCEAETQTDPKNCGACGHVCDGLCKSSCEEVVIKDQLNYPGELLVTQGNVYFATKQAVAKLAADGSGMASGVATLQDANAVPKFLSQDGARLFYFDPTAAAIYYVALPNGGGPTLVASGQAVVGMAADANGMFWADASSREIRRWDVGDPKGYVTVLASTPADGVGALAIGAAEVVFYASISNQLMRVARTGGASATKIVATTPDHVPYLRVVNGTVYYVAVNGVYNSASMHAINVSGAGATPLGLLAGVPNGLAIDDTYFFVSMPKVGDPVAKGEVHRGTLVGGFGMSTVFTNDLPVGGVAVDATRVYWSVPGVKDLSGSVHKREKDFP